MQSRAYAELLGGARGFDGDVAAYVRGELGLRPMSWLSVYGFGEADTSRAWEVGAGAKMTW